MFYLDYDLFISLKAIKAFVAAKPQSATAIIETTKAAAAAVAIAAKAIATAAIMMMMIGHYHLLWVLMMVVTVKINRFWMIMFVVVMVMVMRNILDNFHRLFDMLMLYHFFLFNHQWLVMMVDGFHFRVCMFMM